MTNLNVYYNGYQAYGSGGLGAGMGGGSVGNAAASSINFAQMGGGLYGLPGTYPQFMPDFGGYGGGYGGGFGGGSPFGGQGQNPMMLMMFQMLEMLMGKLNGDDDDSDSDSGSGSGSGSSGGSGSTNKPTDFHFSKEKVDAVFTGADANEDGKVTKSELNKFIKSAKGTDKKAAEAMLAYYSKLDNDAESAAITKDSLTAALKRDGDDKDFTYADVKDAPDVAEAKPSGGKGELASHKELSRLLKEHSGSKDQKYSPAEIRKAAEKAETPLYKDMLNSLANEAELYGKEITPADLEKLAKAKGGDEWISGDKTGLDETRDLGEVLGWQTKQELAVKSLKDNFAAVDKNKNGVLEYSELNAYAATAKENKDELYKIAELNSELMFANIDPGNAAWHGLTAKDLEAIGGRLDKDETLDQVGGALRHQYSKERGAPSDADGFRDWVNKQRQTYKI